MLPQPTILAKCTRAIATVLIATVLSGFHSQTAFATCTPNCPPPPSTWAQYHANENNASFNSNETVLNFANLQTAVPKWTIPVNTGNFQSVVATADVVVAAFDGWYPGGPWTYDYAKVYDTTTAAVKWSLNISEPILANPVGTHYPSFAIAHGTRVYATKRTVDQPNSPAGGIWGYVAQSGAVAGAGLGYLPGSGFDFMSQTSNMAAPTITNGVLYYARQDGGFSAVSTDTGTLMWQYHPVASTIYLNQVAVAGGRVYLVRLDNPGQLLAQVNTLFAVNAITGAAIWQHSFPGQNVVSAPAYYNGSLYVKVRTASLVASRSGMAC